MSERPRFFIVSEDSCEEALAYYEKMVSEHPEDPEAWYELGHDRSNAGLYCEALDAYRKSLRLRPGHTWTQFNIAIVLRDMGRLEQALEAARQLVELDPDSAKSHVLLAGVRVLLGRDDDAKASWETAARIDSSCYEAPYNLGAWHGRRGDYEAASSWFALASRLAPAAELESDRRRTKAECFRLWGLSLADLGRGEEALRALEESVRLNPVDANAPSNLGAVYASFGRKEQALASCERAARLAPQHAMLWFNLGLAQRELGRLADAAEAFAESCRLSPDLPRAAGQLAQSLHALGRDDEAVETLRRMLARRPGREDVYDAWNLLGNLYRRRRLWREAIDAFAQAVATMPDEPSARYNQCLALADSGDLVAARLAAREIRRLDPALAGRLAARLEN